MKTIQIVLNGLGILYFLAILTLGHIDLRTEPRVTELDRAGAFNEPASRATFPQLAENLRYSVAEYIVGDYRRRLHPLATIGLLLLAVNLAITHLNGRTQQKKGAANQQVQPIAGKPGSG